MQNKIAAFLSFVSIGLLIPGLSMPIFALKIDAHVNSKIADISAPLLDREQSILATVQDLWSRDLHLVSFLIFLFSVMVPLTKALGLLAVYFRPQEKLLIFIKRIGKWSMADVFVVAIFLAYLSSQSSAAPHSNRLNLMGFELELTTQAVFTAKLGPGFYWFLSYCLVSLLATELMLFRKNSNE